MNRLAPKVHPLVAALLAAPSTIQDAVRDHGTPLNVVFPEILRENATGFRDAKIFYAHKANRSRSLVRAALDCGLGIVVREQHAAETAFCRPNEYPTQRRRRESVSNRLSRATLLHRRRSHPEHRIGILI